jgi:hypothetical protein
MNDPQFELHCTEDAENSPTCGPQPGLRYSFHRLPVYTASLLTGMLAVTIFANYAMGWLII